MRFPIAALAAYAASVQAFRDTSPFLIFSSSTFPQPLQALSQTQLQPSSHLLYRASSFLRSCSSDIYYIITQPSLSSSDVTVDTFPSLRRSLGEPTVKDRLIISNVQGLDARTPELLLDAIKLGCGEENVEVLDETQGLRVEAALKEGKKVVMVTSFGQHRADALSQVREERDEQLRDNDARADNVLRTIVSGADYTVIYTSTPVNATIISERPERVSYQAEFMDLNHLDLKRNLETRMPKLVNVTDQRPLFEKYQFLTPGLFMGLLVGLILLSILGVGLSAISGLEVSYGAFDKEMGPSAQRKQQ